LEAQPTLEGQVNDRIQYLLDVIASMKRASADWFAIRHDAEGASRFQDVADDAQRALDALTAV